MRLRSVLSITVLGLVFAAGCARKTDDAALVTNIKAQMFSDAQLKGANLQVAAKNGQVTLTGTVPNDAARLDAYKIATQTAGVAKVNDQMTVEGAQTAQAQAVQPTEAAPAQPSEAETAPAPMPKSVEREHRRAERESRHRREVAQAKRNDGSDATAKEEPVATQAQSAEAPAQAPAVPATDSNPPPVTAAPAAAPAPPQPTQIQIPAGTTMAIRMIDGIDSSVNQPGEIFHASLDGPVVVGDQVVVPKDADVYVRLASVTSAGHFKGKSELELQLVKLEFQGQSYPLTSSTYTMAGGSRGKDTAKKVGAGAILGTLIGAIAGGGKGAAVGAAVGAGAGGVYQGATRGKKVNVPSETKLDFQLEQPVTVTVMPHSASSDQ